MFDLLRKKITGFTQKILQKEEELHADEKVPEEEVETPPSENTIKETTSQNERNTNETETVFQSAQEEQSPNAAEQEIIEEKIVATAESETQPAFDEEKTTRIAIIEKEEPVPKELPKISQRGEITPVAKVGITKRIGSIFSGTISLDEGMMTSFLEEFELSLLEADVEMDTATALIEELHHRLAGKKISAREDPSAIILNEIRHALRDILPINELNLDNKIEENKPSIVLILGPNGAGKTTTIAKLTNRYTQMGKKVILASADTFRAGSIEQLQVHAEKLGVRMVKHQYGADPAAVAFDAVNAAKADGADVVFIDTAGRQDTNKSLLEELKKIDRVIQPHVKLYVGESYTGQAILTQVKTFDEAIGIDGFILTKLDADTKGGGVLSILHQLKKPIVFFGIGQGYNDLAPFSMDTFLERIVPRN